MTTRSVALVVTTERYTDRYTNAADMLQMCCLQLKLLSNVIPRFCVDVTGDIFQPQNTSGKKPLTFFELTLIQL